METGKWIEINSNVSDDKISQKKVLTQEMMDGGNTGSIKLTYELGRLWEDTVVHGKEEYISIGSNTTGTIQEVGAPALPQEGLFVALPRGARFKELKIIDSKYDEIERKQPVLPVPEPVFENENISYNPNPLIYRSDAVYPGKIAEYIGTNEIGGVKAAHIMLYLAQYTPKEGKISFLKYLKFEVIYEFDNFDSDDKPVVKGVNRAIASMVLGFDGIPDTFDSIPDGEDDSLLKSPNNRGEFLIVTTNDLKGAFESFIHIRSSEYRVKIVTKEEIKNEFRNPKEEVAIKDFLIYAAQSWVVAPRYVILGGNIDKIPTFKRTDSASTFSSDHYYADLNDDMIPELCVSRFPASTVSIMTRLCDASISYYGNYGDWHKNVLLTTFRRDDYEECKNKINNRIKLKFNPIKKYDGVATKQDVINTINTGVGFINYRGHGCETSWQASIGLRNSDIPSLKNDKMLPHVLSIACSNNTIEYNTGNTFDCFGINWMINKKAASFLGASSPSYTTINHIYDEYLWDAIENEGIENICDIFQWATIKLQANNPGEATNHNIYMYLLLGDPTLNYKKIPVSPTTGFVLMLDRSGTMRDAIEQVKIDSKAFIRETRSGDQFGINQFSDDADWVYPKGNDPQIVTVSDDLHETEDAEKEIEKIKIQNMTNMGAAILLGNKMIAQATTDVRAFVVLSDGLSNYGPVKPEIALGNEPPIFVAGLGPYLSKDAFKKLLDKNPNSKYYHQPHATDMALTYNDIRSLTPNTRLMTNVKNQYSMGADYQLVKAIVTEDSDKTQFAVVWSDKRFKYTSGYPNGYNISVSLVDPRGKNSLAKPEIVGEGYCIFNLSGMEPGEWKVLIEYSIKEFPNGVVPCGTVGGFQFGTAINALIDIPPVFQKDKTLDFKVNVFDGGNPIEGLNVSVQVTKPEISVDNALIKYADSLQKIKVDYGLFDSADVSQLDESIMRLHTLRMQNSDGNDILGVQVARHYLSYSPGEGLYKFAFNDTFEAGSYSFDVQISGIDRRTGKKISFMKKSSVLIG